MTIRRLVQFIGIILIFLGLMVAPVHGAEGEDLVGVRLPPGSPAKLPDPVLASSQIIDYGSFLWMITTRDTLPALAAAGIDYQTVENPFELQLGGAAFDPLAQAPLFTANWGNKPAKGGAGLHLVQFQGPIQQAWLDALEADGVEVIQYLHPFTYLVWGEPAAVEKSRSENAVRWTGAYLPAYAVQPQFRTLSNQELEVWVLIFRGADTAEVLQECEAKGAIRLGLAAGIDPDFEIAHLALPGNLIPTVAQLPGVYSVQPIPTDGGERGEMSNQINAGNYNDRNLAFTGYQAWLGELGLSGEGVVIANVDSGIENDHPDLAGQLLPCEGASCGGAATRAHGTHTAGIMAGNGNSGVVDAYGFLRGLGMAPGASLIEQLYEPTYKETGGMLKLMTESYLNGAVISGNSWGPSSSKRGYDLDTRLVDIGVRDAVPDAEGNQPLTYVLSIMNGYGVPSSQGTPDEAKNIFTIGSTYMQESNGKPDDRINDLSLNTGFGPASDGRTIPHLVAPGWYVDSTYPYSTHSVIGGTSMASPHVSGAAALFIEQYRQRFDKDPSPALIKAAFTAVAHDLAGNKDANGEILGHPFDSKQGWGRLNAAAVLDPEHQVEYFDQVVILNNTGETWSLNIESEKRIGFLHIMLVWTDAPGHGNGGSEPAWNNDLDLSLKVGDKTYYGNNFGEEGFSVPGGTPDFMNNTEGIFMPSLPAGKYTISITAANINSDGVPGTGDETDQDFALVYYISPEVIRERLIFPIFFH